MLIAAGAVWWENLIRRSNWNWLKPTLLSLIPTALKQRSELALENLALRQKLAILNRLQRGRRSR
jgi:hypothetical protein